MRKGIRKMKVQLDPKELVTDFVETKKLQGLGQFGIEAIEYSLGRFLNYCGGDLPGIALRKSVLEFLNAKNIGHAYYNKRLSILSQFFKHCMGLGAMEQNPCEGFKYKTETSRIVDHNEESIRDLLKLPNQKSFSGYRDYLLIMTILDNGIRPYEAQQLRITDMQDYTIRIRAEVSKTRTERYVPISKTTYLAIKKLINARHESWDKNGTIFCAYTGQRMSPKSMQIRMREYSGKLGTTITLYDLRHTFAVTYIRNGGSAFSLQAIMGHSTLEMTRKYVNVATTDVMTSHMACSPLKNFLADSQKRIVLMPRSNKK